MDILTFFDIFLKPPQPFTGLFFDENNEGEIVKESLQEWLCDNRQQITSCILITLRNHERSYAEWFAILRTAQDQTNWPCIA